MAFSLPNVQFSSITWMAADMAVEPGNSTSYGNCGITLTIQGPEDPNFVYGPSITYWLPEDTPSYLVAYQRCYEHLKNSVNLSPDQMDQFEQWNQRIVEEVNAAWAAAGLPAPDLNGNDWSMNAPFFTTYANKMGIRTGQFELELGNTVNNVNQPLSGGSGF